MKFMEIINFLTSILSHPLSVVVIVLTLLVLLVSKSEKIDFETFESKLFLLIQRIFTIMVIIVIGYLEWNEYKNVAPFLHYLKFYDDGRTLQLILFIGFLASLYLPIELEKTSTNSIRSKIILYLILGVVFLVQLTVLYYGWLAYLAPYPNKPETDITLGMNRFVTLLIQIGFNLFLNFFGVLISLKNNKPTVSTTIPLSSVVPSTIVTTPPPAETNQQQLSTGGAISYTTPLPF